MKVLQINSFFTVGGPPRIMNGIYDTLRENGFDCKIAAAREKMYVPKDSFRVGSNISVKVNALKARLFDNEGFNAVHATRELVKYIEEYDPDVIHLHNLHGYCFNLESLFDYLRKAGKPVVWTLHDCWPFTGHCAYFDITGCEQWKTECRNCRELNTYPVCYGKGRVTENFKLKKKLLSGLNNLTFVTPSQWLAQELKQSFLSEYPVMVIHNGINIDQFKPYQNNFIKDHGLEHKKIVVGVAQVWDERKGYNDFLKLADVLGDAYKVVMVGLSEKQLKELPDNIIGVTRTSNIQELTDIYSSGTVFANLTYEDNFPTVNIEALACGIPVITYRTGGSPEAIDDSCGWVVEQGDLEGVKRIIAGLNDKSEYTAACRARSRLFDRKARYREYIDLYQEILKG